MRVPTSPLVIRATEMRAHADAASIRAAAMADAAAIRNDAIAAAAATMQQGHAEGVLAGTAQAARLAAGAAQAVDTFWQTRENELRELAFAIAHRILASLPPQEAMLRLAREAIAEHRRDVRLTLRAAPGDASALRQALSASDPDGRVAVEADPAARPGSCTLVHPRGRTRVGLVEQFQALMRDAA